MYIKINHDSSFYINKFFINWGHEIQINSLIRNPLLIDRILNINNADDINVYCWGDSYFGEGPLFLELFKITAKPGDWFIMDVIISTKRVITGKKEMIESEDGNPIINCCKMNCNGIECKIKCEITIDLLSKFFIITYNGYNPKQLFKVGDILEFPFMRFTITKSSAPDIIIPIENNAGTIYEFDNMEIICKEVIHPCLT